jgi:predicted metalloprotease with PDZ domain
MAGVDLNTYRFDYDLTFAMLLMSAAGEILHTYGGRDWTDPQSHLSLRSLERLLDTTLREHAATAPAPPASGAKLEPPLPIEQLPVMKERIARGKAPKCFHCHMVNGVRYEQLRRTGKWSREVAFTHPDPVEIGLRLDKDDQQRVPEVVEKSPAAAAGIRPGDRLVMVGDRRVATLSDAQAASVSLRRRERRCRWS